MQTRTQTVILLGSLALSISGCQPPVTPPASIAATSSANVSPAILPASAGPIVAPGSEWFHEVTKDTGIDFCHFSGTNAEKPFPAANGSGLAAFDYDLDGHCDLYFATGTSFPINRNARTPSNRCYRNRGDWRFQEVTALCGLGHAGYSAGVAVGDYNSDGFPDVFVACYGADVLYRNCGDGTFLRCDQAGVADERWGASAAFLDADNDGLLDLYVCNYAKWTWETRRWCGDNVRNIREYCSPHSVEADDDALYRNQGAGQFDDATAEMGLLRTPARAQGVVAADLDGNGLCDLYVGNDLQPNFLFLNQGGGKFTDATESSGAAYNHQGKVQAGMGVDAADVNGDGQPELYVTNFSNEPNTLYDNLGHGAFQDATMQRGLHHDSLPYIGWGTAMVDFNLDGWTDVVVTNGPLRANEPAANPPLLWQNVNGRFRILRAEAGEYFRAVHAGRGLAVADLDNDGDVDVVIGHHDGKPGLLSNERLKTVLAENRSVTLRLVGTRSNRDCIGASLWTTWGEETRLAQVKGGGSYLSSHDVRQVLAVPPDAESIRCEIQWPGGERSSVESLRSGASYVIIQPRSSIHPPYVFEVPQ
jgi:enediyne biosynthesis protein E4